MKIELFSADLSSEFLLPFANEGIRAGFPSPAQNYLSEAIDLNKELIKHPASTFYARVVGDSMINEDIHDGDLLVIDKSLEPRDGDTVVAYVDGEFTLKYIKIERDIVWLMPANDVYPPIKVTEKNDFMVWGVVTYSIKKHRRRI